MEKIEIKSIGFDSFDREVFQTAKGSLLCDIALDYSHKEMILCTKLNNEFDGEPDTTLKSDRFVVVKEFTEEKKYYGDDDGRAE